MNALFRQKAINNVAKVCIPGTFLYTIPLWSLLDDDKRIHIKYYYVHKALSIISECVLKFVDINVTLLFYCNFLLGKYVETPKF